MMLILIHFNFKYQISTVHHSFHTATSDFEEDFQDLIGCRRHLRSKMFAIRKYLLVVNKEQSAARYSPSSHPSAPLGGGRR